MLLTALVSLSLLHCTLTADVKCFDQICVNPNNASDHKMCYLKNNRQCNYNAEKDEVSCRQMYSLQEPQAICSTTVLEQCTCEHSDQKLAFCQCKFRSSAKVIIGVVCACIFVVFVAAVCFARWYIKKKGSMLRHLHDRDEKHGDGMHLTGVNSSTEDARGRVLSSGLVPQSRSTATAKSPCPSRSPCPPRARSPCPTRPPKSPRGPPKSPRGPPKSPRGPPKSPRGPPKSPRGPPKSPCGSPKSTPAQPAAKPAATLTVKPADYKTSSC